MIEERGERYLTTAEVARRLGVKPETVYAYVSRGLLTSVRSVRRRGSLFAPSEVDRLAERGRDSHGPSGAIERVRTELTWLHADELYYRGHRVTELAATTPVESVAHLLMTGELADRPPFPAPGELVGMARAAIATLPPRARLTDQLRVAVAVLGTADPLRYDLSPPAVIRTGETLLGAMVDALPPADPTGSQQAAAGGTLAERLWPKLTGSQPEPAVLNAALVLLADHDLAVSTLAARVAASARAHPYAVVSAGLGALDGHHHGTASTWAYRFLADALGDPVAALSERLRTGGGVPGFGHRVYEHRDPRADLLLAMLRDTTPRTPVLTALETITAELADRPGTFPNVDLALAALTHAFHLRPDAGEAVFAVARTVGWIAHAMEEYTQPALRFRALGDYTGSHPAH